MSVLVSLLMLAAAAAADAATLRVTTTSDPTLPSAKCSLREAVETVNSPGTKTSCGTADNFTNYIILQAKTYKLSIPPGTGDSVDNCVNPSKIIPPADQNATGDLCITSKFPVSIVGRGPTTIVEGTSSLKDRLMTIGPQASVALVALDLEGGHAPAGAGDAVSCALGANTDEDGGAVYNTGSLTTNVVTIEGNSAGAGSAGAAGFDGCGGGSGGGVYNLYQKKNKMTGALHYPGALTIQNTMFIGNVAGTGGAGGAGVGSSTGGTGGVGGTGGGIYNDGGTLLVTSSSVALDKSGAGGTGGHGGTSGSGGNGGTGGAGSPGGGIYSAGGSLSVTNSTFAGDLAGNGGDGGKGKGSSGDGGHGGAGANGGALAVNDGASGVLNATIATNGPGVGGGGGTGPGGGGGTGAGGSGGGVFVQSSRNTDDMTLQNSIASSNGGGNCLGSSAKAIVDGGHNLSFGDTSCPAVTNGNPKLKAFADYGGYTGTLALAPGSAAINKVPAKGAHCPPTDQRGVSRPQGSACDIGAFEFATPKISIYTPRDGAKYKRGSKVLASFVCSEGGITDPQITPIKKCTGTVKDGKRINTSSLGKKSFKVSADDLSGNKSSKTVHYTVVR